LRMRGIEPVVTLHHFTNPLWFAEEGGWRRRESPQHYLRYVERVVEALAPEVRFWITVNEPTVYAKRAYLVGDWPPFRRGDLEGARRVVAAMSRAHRLAYTAIHRIQPGARVGFAHSAPFVMAKRATRPADRFVAAVRDRLLNTLPVRLAAGRGGRCLDFLGINYYNRALVHWSPRGRAWLVGDEGTVDERGRPRCFSDLGWEIYPRGLFAVLHRFAALGVPLLVSENGLATRDEVLRSRFLVDHLRAVAEALRCGIPVFGYLWWSLIDNYEWAEGFAPRFGLFAVDYRTQKRHPRPAAHLFARICRHRRLPAPEMTGAADPT